MNSEIMDSQTGPVRSSGLYAGDQSQLALDTRRTLCKLLCGPFLDADHPCWPALLRDEDVVRSRLSDVFLELVIDRERKVAFSRQADTGEIDAPVLLRTQALTFIDSVLLLHLRHALVEAEGQDQRAVVATTDLAEQLSLYAAPDGGDPVLANTRIEASIKKMREAGVLRLLPGPEKRYEVSPVLRLLFTADDVEALGSLYRAAANAGQPISDGAQDDDE
jgi:Domain of unknown function (DUF4194)